MDDTKRRCAVCESRSVGREGRDLSFGNAAQIALWFHGAATGGDCEEEWEEIVSKRRESRLEKVLTSVSCIAKMCACWCNWCCCAKNLDEVDMRTKLDAYNNEAKAQSKVRAPRRKKQRLVDQLGRETGKMCRRKTAVASLTPLLCCYSGSRRMTARPGEKLVQQDSCRRRNGWFESLSSGTFC